VAHEASPPRLPRQPAAARLPDRGRDRTARPRGGTAAHRPPAAPRRTPPQSRRNRIRQHPPRGCLVAARVDPPQPSVFPAALVFLVVVYVIGVVGVVGVNKTPQGSSLPHPMQPVAVLGLAGRWCRWSRSSSPVTASAGASRWRR